jgi:integrase
MNAAVLKFPSPNSQNRTVSPRKGKKNDDLRPRGEYLTPAEVEQMAKTAKGNRHGLRDATMIRMAFHHGLRATELVNLEWTRVNFDAGTLTVHRAKEGDDAVHHIDGNDLRALRKLRKAAPAAKYMFTSERGAAPFAESGFAKMVERAAKKAGLEALKVHPHMLRHACGYALVNAGRDTRSLQAYLGHKNIRHTEKYTKMSPDRFKDFGKGAW